MAIVGRKQDAIRQVADIEVLIRNIPAVEQGLKVVAGAGFEPAVRQSPDYEPDERLRPVSLKNPSPRP